MGIGLENSAAINVDVGPYRLIRQLGSGGMGMVYLAYQATMNRYVALKVIHQAFADRPRAVERFQREAQIIAQLEHANIVPVYDYNGSHIPPYIVMRYIPAGTLRDITLRGKLPLADITHIFSQITSAVDYAHRQGVIHRDIKPSNILIDAHGNAYLSDFGLALTAEMGGKLSAWVVGTPGYMAPEQAQKLEVDGRADVYSLGVVLFELVTGQPPFVAESPTSIMLMHVQNPVPSARAIVPTIAPELDAILQRAIAKQPEDRYPTAGELGHALRVFARSVDAVTQTAYLIQSVQLTITDLKLPSRETVSAAPSRQEELQQAANRFKWLSIALAILGMIGGLFFLASLVLQDDTDKIALGVQGTLTAAAPTLAPAVDLNAPLHYAGSTTIGEVNGEQMMQDIRTLVNFHTRHVCSTQTPATGIIAAQAWLLGRLKDIANNSSQPSQAYVHTFPAFDWYGRVAAGGNVVLVLPGTDPNAGTAIIGAHYDTILIDWDDCDSFQPGADDNASGVAAVLEIARIMSRQPHAATLIFVLFAAEEEGRLGSIAFIEDQVQAQNMPLIAMLNLDKVGSPTGVGGNFYLDSMRVYSAQPNTSVSRHLARMVYMAGRWRLPEVTVVVKSTHDRPGRFGDHQSFSDAGYASVRLIEMEDDEFSHTQRDIETDIDANYLKHITQVALATLEMLADGPLPPADLSLDNPGKRFLNWSPLPTCAQYVIALRSPDLLVYDGFFTVTSPPFEWDGLLKYEAVSIACIDAQGRLGHFAPEVVIDD
jgi:serine/threonine protein kinase